MATDHNRYPERALEDDLLNHPKVMKEALEAYENEDVHDNHGQRTWIITKRVPGRRRKKTKRTDRF